MIPEGIEQLRDVPWSRLGLFLVIWAPINTAGIGRAVNRTVYGYGRTPYGKYTASDRTVFNRTHLFESPRRYGTVTATAVYGQDGLYGTV